MLLRIALVRTDVSEELSASVIRVTTIGELGTKNKTNSMALSLRANYTDWTTATCRRNLVPTFVDIGVSHGQRGGSPTVVNLRFLDRSSSFILTKAEWTTFQTHCYSGNLAALGIEPGTSGLAARNSDN
jgi:hypothetical protein